MSSNTKAFPPSYNLLGFTLSFLSPYKLYVVAFVLCAVMTALYIPINAFLIKTIINRLGSLSPDSTIDVINILFWPAILFVTNFEAHHLAWRGQALVSYTVLPTLKKSIISQTTDYVFSHSHQYFQDNLAGSIANNIKALADNLTTALQHNIFQLLRGGFLIITALISTYIVHPIFCIGLSLWVVLFGVTSYVFSRKVVVLSDTQAESESVVTGQIVDCVSNIQNIRLFARRGYEYSYLDTHLDKMKQTFKEKEWYLLKMHLMQGFCLTILVAFMITMLIHLRAKNLVTTGDFAFIIGMSIEVGYTLWWVTEQNDLLNTAIGKCKQSLKALLVPLDILDGADSKSIKVTKGQIRFENVQFQYKGAEPLFEKKTITIHPGQKVGLVGYSGGGKTTFVNLILRLYEVNSGQILIDGQDIKTISSSSLRSVIGMIPQDPSLFHRSIMDNIRYGLIGAKDEDVIHAAKLAHAHEFISSLPEGYQSLVGERGIKLSGGQRQRVAIARAILKNAPILILDEATSQLDSITESAIQDSLWHLMQDKTTLVIAHRLSTLMHMDRILVFEKGKIIQDGNHEELLKKGGLYKQLWDAQVGGFLLDSLNKEVL